MTNEEAINRLGLDIDMVQFDPITGNRKCLFGDEKELAEAQRLGMEALRAQKVGKWLEHNANYQGTAHVYSCSICAYWQAINTKFCPNCGARMEGQE